jgi:TonB family protein
VRFLTGLREIRDNFAGLHAQLIHSMSERFRLAILLFALALVPLPSFAQRPNPARGPVVGAYLLGLSEELNELNFQLRHREISKGEYDRALQRLSILRRYVEKETATQREDRVPELQVLAEDELGKLGVTPVPEPGSMQVGGLVGDRWTLRGVERANPRFFIFELSEVEEPPARQGSYKGEVIETIVVPESVLSHPSRSDPDPAHESVQSVNQSDSRPRFSQPAPAPAAVTTPRITGFYMPTYTKQAREKGIEGDLIVTAVFQRNGKIKDVKVERGLGSGLDERAKESVKKTTFEPALLGADPVDVQLEIAFNFKLAKVTVHVLNAERR